MNKIEEFHKYETFDEEFEALQNMVIENGYTKDVIDFISCSRYKYLFSLLLLPVDKTHWVSLFERFKGSTNFISGVSASDVAKRILDSYINGYEHNERVLKRIGNLIGELDEIHLKNLHSILTRFTVSDIVDFIVGTFPVCNDGDKATCLVLYASDVGLSVPIIGAGYKYIISMKDYTLKFTREQRDSEIYFMKTHDVNYKPLTVPHYTPKVYNFCLVNSEPHLLKLRRKSITVKDDFKMHKDVITNIIYIIVDGHKIMIDSDTAEKYQYSNLSGYKLFYYQISNEKVLESIKEV